MMLPGTTILYDKCVSFSNVLLQFVKRAALTHHPRDFTQLSDVPPVFTFPIFQRESQHMSSDGIDCAQDIKSRTRRYYLLL